HNACSRALVVLYDGDPGYHGTIQVPANQTMVQPIPNITNIIWAAGESNAAAQRALDAAKTAAQTAAQTQPTQPQASAQAAPQQTPAQPHSQQSAGAEGHALPTTFLDEHGRPCVTQTSVERGDENDHWNFQNGCDKVLIVTLRADGGIFRSTGIGRYGTL